MAGRLTPDEFLRFYETELLLAEAALTYIQKLADENKLLPEHQELVDRVAGMMERAADELGIQYEPGEMRIHIEK